MQCHPFVRFHENLSKRAIQKKQRRQQTNEPRKETNLRSNKV